MIMRRIRRKANITLLQTWFISSSCTCNFDRVVIFWILLQECCCSLEHNYGTKRNILQCLRRFSVWLHSDMARNDSICNYHLFFFDLCLPLKLQRVTVSLFPPSIVLATGHVIVGVSFVLGFGTIGRWQTRHGLLADIPYLTIPSVQFDGEKTVPTKSGWQEHPRSLLLFSFINAIIIFRASCDEVIHLLASTMILSRFGSRRHQSWKAYVLGF